MKSTAGARAVQLVFVTAFLGLWYVIGRTGAVSTLFVPRMEAVAAAFESLVQTDQFWAAARVTLSTIMQAYLFLTRLLEPVISGLFAIPITLLFPLFILLFGIGPASKVAYGAAYAFFPIALNTIAGFANVDRRYLDAARSMGFPPSGVFRHVLLPAAFPVILTGLRIGFFICFASVLGGETISSLAGVGRNIALAAELMEPARMYSWIVVVIIAALLLNALVSAVENRMRRE